METAESNELKTLITELTVEPIRTDGEVSDRYINSILARLREVALSRVIAEIKSTLQRLNPVENEVQYQEIFSKLVEMEAARRVQRELALGES
jgi:DNA primase